MKQEHKDHLKSKIETKESNNSPFYHMELEEILPLSLAEKLYEEFPDYEDEVWFKYKNKIEDKKLLSDWRQFPQATYELFTFLTSQPFLDFLSDKVGCKLYADPGLHGGGWHIHKNGGKLNPHLDYSLHPMLKLQRKLNLIIYLCKDWQEEYGGHFGFWKESNTEGQVGELVKEISMGFNKAVLFDTTQNSWHGLSREVSCPEGIYRKSLAIYYLTDPPKGVDSRSRALFSPTEEQKDSKEVIELIKKRSDFNKSKEVYL